MDTFSNVAVLEGHFKRPTVVLISPNGDTVVSAGEDNRVNVWDDNFDYDRLIDYMCTVLRRDLSSDQSRRIVGRTASQRNDYYTGILGPHETPNRCRELRSVSPSGSN
jgi:WD40 repeat protein